MKEKLIESSSYRNILPNSLILFLLRPIVHNKKANTEGH